ncbi:hypothetical protein BP6252_11713 [Coleophoma cylindrospora]|uniref:Glucosamine 6-phosphate N-acetyltransferase n=1 Tax=Coleophoma cylindrospora TaxID=1849047 RepID=A0A3D8QKV6_9HELO|nr:hypothetical protein BP6252_11713 [Coleophoma cylindrospora]
MAATTSTSLFDASLISPEVASSFPDGYQVRPLERGDYAKGFFECLQVLTSTGDISSQQFDERFDWMSTQGKGTYFFLVIEAEGRIVGTGALIVERKFIHNLGTVGHIEEISIQKDQQGKKLGLKMIHAIDSVAANTGCYKTILNCGERNEGFYLKCGYRKQALEMAKYFEAEKNGYERG